MKSVFILLGQVWTCTFCILRDGTKVTAEENKLFISIFKYVSDEGDSVEAHFYSEEDCEKGNVNLDIWRGPLSKYTSLVGCLVIKYSNKEYGPWPEKTLQPCMMQTSQLSYRD